MYRVAQKGGDCKDDRKLFKYNYSKAELSLLPILQSFTGLLFNLKKKETS